MADLARDGWTGFAAEPSLTVWARHADRAAMAAADDPANAAWLRCNGTWFVGVDALPNDGAGRLPGGPPLAGTVVEAARAIADLPLHRAQASVCYPGYPKQGGDEEDAAFGFRLRRDAAHVDGLHRIMPGRRRLLHERHAWIMGVPLNDSPAAPMTVWEGSHEIMRTALTRAFAGVPPRAWADHDITDAYQTARRTCFGTCRRVKVRAPVGGAYLIHRLALHGVAPWDDSRAGDETGDRDVRDRKVGDRKVGDDTAGAQANRRAIAYFRPAFDTNADGRWLSAP